MTVQIATTDKEIAACYPVMRELRPHVSEIDFLGQVWRQAKAGYRLAYVKGREGVLAVAGFRIGENLAWGRFLYVDDLVTLPGYRSQGYGGQLLSWLKAYASKESCAQLHLDSGTQRKDAHRFYERQGMTVTGLHFAEDIPIIDFK